MAQIWVDIQPGVLNDFSLLGTWESSPTVEDMGGGSYAININEATTVNPRSLIYDLLPDVSNDSEVEVYCVVTAVEYFDDVGNATAAGAITQQTVIDAATASEELGVSSRAINDSRLYDRVSGTYSADQFTGPLAQVGNTYALRLRVEQTQFFGKAWSTSDNEPVGFQASRARPAIATGVSGVRFFREGEYRIHALSFGTDGDPAPTEPVGVGAETITATADPSLAADHAATLQPTPATLAATADLTLAQDYAATIGTQPDAIQATADASLSADYAALLQPQPVTLAATPDASEAADYAGAIQPTPVTLTASSDLTLGADYAATITEVDAPVVLQASADLSLGADYAASVVAVPVTISIGFDAGLGADFAASIPSGFVRRLRPADEALHEALYSRLRSLRDAAGYTDVPVFDRLPDAGRAPSEKPTAMP